MAMGFVGKFFTIFTAVTIYALLGNLLSSMVVFPCLLFYMAINRVFLQSMPIIVRVIADLKVTRDRLQVMYLCF